MYFKTFIRLIIDHVWSIPVAVAVVVLPSVPAGPHVDVPQSTTTFVHAPAVVDNYNLKICYNNLQLTHFS